MSILSSSKMAVIFLLGFFCALLVSHFVTLSLELPYAPSITGKAVAPHDILSEDDILVYPDRVVIKVDGASVSRYAPTKSMAPVLDKGANGIRIRPSSEESISVGDIITYKSEDGLIVHRVIEKNTDGEGTYFVAKGDNSERADAYRIRFKDIEWVTIALVY